MSFRPVASTALMLAALIAGPALAQTKPAKTTKPAATTDQAASPDDAAAPAAAPAQNTIPDTSGPQPDWVKICQKDEKAKIEVCQTSRDLRAATGQTLASVAFREQKSEKGVRRGMVMAIPPGMQIQPGVRVLIDQQSTLMGKYTVCMPSACIVEAEVSDAVMGNLRKGTTLNLQVVNPANKGVLFQIALKGLAGALDNAPLDPKAVQDEQKLLNEQLRKRAEEELKKMQATPPAP